MIARIGLAGIIRANTRFAPTTDHGFGRADHIGQRTGAAYCTLAFGQGKPCPYECDDAVNTVRHDGERVQFNGLSQLCRSQPFFADSHALFVRLHLSINDIAEKAFALASAHCHEIRPRLRIIVPFQACRSAMVSIWVAFHLSITLGH